MTPRRAVSLTISILILLDTVSARPKCPNTYCTTAINACGITYSGCHDLCTTQTTPWLTTPPCPSTSTSTTSCTPGTICIDGVNTCGIRWGTCYDTCSSPSHLSTPACPSSTSPSVSPATTTSARKIKTSHTTSSSTATTTTDAACYVYGNSHGEAPVRALAYYEDGRFAWCEPASPTTTTPANATTTKRKGKTASHAITSAKTQATTTTAETGKETAISSSSCGPSMVCADGVDACGRDFEVCFDSCKGSLSDFYTPRPCDMTSTVGGT